MTQLVACTYEADILEDLVMEECEESGDRSWTNTVKHFVKEYGVVTIAAERAAQRAGYESSATFREDDRPPLENAPHTTAPGPSTEDYDTMSAYMKALENDNQELRSVGGRSNETTSLSETHEIAASAIATNTATEMMELAAIPWVSLRLVVLLLLPHTYLMSWLSCSKAFIYSVMAS